MGSLSFLSVRCSALERTQGFAADPDYWKGEVFAYVGLPENLKDLKVLRVDGSPHKSLLYRPVIVGCSPPQDDATVKCWGMNAKGQLGLGDTSNRGDDANGPCPPSSTSASLVPAPQRERVLYCQPTAPNPPHHLDV